MINIPNISSIKQRVKDLEEGDIAVINPSPGNLQLVYVFRSTPTSPLEMVSLNELYVHWKSIEESNIKVIKIFQPGETLTIK